MAFEQPPAPEAAADKQERSSDDDAGSVSSSWTRYTPKTGFSYRASDCGSQLQNSPLGDIPWYDKVYMILDKTTRKAITYTGSGLLLCDVADGPDASNSWLCVSHNNFTGFLNKKSRCYLSHDKKEIGSTVYAHASKCEEAECFMPRAHPKGGFLLLSAYGKQMRILVKTSEGKIERAFHGDTLWIFEEV